MVETWIYNDPLWLKYDKYLGAFGFALASRNTGTINPLFCPLEQITQVVWEQLRLHAKEGVSVK